MQNLLAAVLATLLSGAAGASQEQSQDPPKPPVRQLPTQQGRATPRIPVESIEAVRGGQTVDVVRSFELVELDLSRIDLEADPVLLFDGRPVSRRELVARVCLLVGSNEIDQFITFVLAQDIKKELTDAGHSLAGVEVSEEEITTDIESQKAMAPRMYNMSPDEWEGQIREHMGWERFVELRKVQLGFEKLFLPDAPEGFMEVQAARYEQLQKDQSPPEETEEGGQAAPPANPQELPVPEADLSFLPSKTFELLDEQLAKVIRESYARGQPLHPILKMGIGAAIKRNLMSKVDVNFAPAQTVVEGRNVLFTVEGKPVFADEVMQLVRPRLQPSVWRLALREILAERAVDRALDQLGARFTEERAAESFAALEKQYERSLIPLPQAAVLLGFSNLYHYRRYLSRKAAYREYLKSKVTEEDVLNHFERGARLYFENGSFDGTILFLAGETREAAALRMDEALSQVAEGKPFEQVAREIGEFPSGKDVRDGRVTAQVRNRMRQILGESEYLSYVTGYSVVDDSFYRGVEGEVIGPVYRDYSPKLTGSVALQLRRYYTGNAQRSLEEYGRDRVIEDMADLTFVRFVNDALRACSVEVPQ